MDLKKEYGENLRIDGKPAVLDFVENFIDPATGETVIRRRYIIAGRPVQYKIVEERLPAAKPPAPAPAAPAPKPGKPAEKQPEKPAAKTFPRPVSIKAKTGKLAVKDLTSGQCVVYHTKTGREAGVVAKVSFRTFCIDIDGVKDLQVRKSDLVGLYLED